MTVSAIHPLPKVAVGRHLSSESVNLENYRSWVGDTLTDEIRELSKELQGVRICNVNAWLNIFTHPLELQFGCKVD